MKASVAILAVLVGVLLVVPTAEGGNCHVGRGFQQAVVVQNHGYVAPTYSFQQHGYSTIYPQALPVPYIPDTFYRVDSAIAYARIAEAAAEAAAGKVAGQQSQQLLKLFQDFLQQQAQLQKLPPAAPEPQTLPQAPAAPPAKGIIEHGTQAAPKAKTASAFFTANCTRCHNPNNPKRMNLQENALAKLTQKEGNQIYFRITAPNDHARVMPPKEKGKTRLTTPEDIDVVHEWVSGLPE